MITSNPSKDWEKVLLLLYTWYNIKYQNKGSQPKYFANKGKNYNSRANKPYKIR
jgi:hypothetical protein